MVPFKKAVALFCVLFLFFAIQASGRSPEGDPEPKTRGFKLLFIHHSCGMAWLHPDNGGLRPALEDPARNDFLFEVHDAWGKDTIGVDTDVCDWLPKFETMLDLVLTFDETPDIYYTEPGDFNRIVMFKSCYSASDIKEEGTPPGDPYSPNKTIWNYKAAYLACAEIFKEHPGILWIPVTAPPRHRDHLQNNGLPYYTKEKGLNAWAFNDWLAGGFVENYRKETGLSNLAAFNWFAILANPKSDPDYPGALKDIYSQDPYLHQSHPNQAGNQAGTEAFIPFINEAMHAWRGFRGDKYTLTASGADAVSLHLDAGPDHGGRPYVVLGSASGTSPGFDPGGFHMALNRDHFMSRTFRYAGFPNFPAFQGRLNPSGRARAFVRTLGPLPPSAVGKVYHFAFLVAPPVEFASPVVPVTVVP